MTCEECSTVWHRFGVHRNGLRRVRCPRCWRIYTEPHALTLNEMYAKAKVLTAIQMLLEGNSIRSTMRITGLHQNTIMKALVLAGERCEKVMGRLIVNVPIRDIECDEIWGFVQKKEGTKRRGNRVTKPSETPTVSSQSSAIQSLFLTSPSAAGARPPPTSSSKGFAMLPRHVRSRSPPVRALREGYLRHAGRPRRLRATGKGLPGPAEGPVYSPAEIASTKVAPVLGNPDRSRICASTTSVVSISRFV